MTQTVEDALIHDLVRKLDESINTKKEQLCSYLLEDREYVNLVGKLHGAQEAKNILVEVIKTYFPYHVK